MAIAGTPPKMLPSLRSLGGVLTDGNCAAPAILHAFDNMLCKMLQCLRSWLSHATDIQDGIQPWSGESGSVGAFSQLPCHPLRIVRQQPELHSQGRPWVSAFPAPKNSRSRSRRRAHVAPPIRIHLQLHLLDLPAGRFQQR